MPDPSSLESHAIAVWRAGLDSVDSHRLITGATRATANSLQFLNTVVDCRHVERILVVGAGKAGAGMAAGLEDVLSTSAPALFDRVSGMLNVPADCVRPLQRITLHAARPAGLNEPTEAGVAGACRIRDLLKSLTERDVCVVLLSGGGSALLPLPKRGISLADKQAVTRLLMENGASIGELNCVRRHLSQLKGGGLVRQTAAGVIVSLIISDVIDDPLNVIASGPTVPDSSSPADALQVLRPFADRVPATVLQLLAKSPADDGPETDFRRVQNIVIGNNQTALTACAVAAEQLGYTVLNLGSQNAGVAADVGAELADLARSIRDRGTPVAPPACVLSGGEPIVNLVPTTQERRGGRNQELALAALLRLGNDGDSIVILSGGTDGEDGPTDAAGAVVTAATTRRAEQLRLSPAKFLAVNNSYPFLDATDALLRTGPTHTNVMDLRVVLVGPPDRASV